MSDKNGFIKNIGFEEIPEGLTLDNIPKIGNDLITMEDSFASAVLDKSKEIMGTMVLYKELMMMYTCAIKEVRTKFEVLNTEFNVRYSRNPINFINTRLKRTSSVLEKLERKNAPFTVESIEKNINDIAGIRVICSYIDDIYFIADALTKQDDIKLIDKKDYIANPKPNGYRSLHLIVSVPVFFAEQTRNMKVEVQIRTIAMDFWASLEHQLKYKHSIENQEEIVEQLHKCAETITDTDKKMLEIRRMIEKNGGDVTPDDELFEKIRKIDISIN